VPRVYEASEIQGDALRVAVVVERFNQAVTDALLTGAVEALTQRGVPDDSIYVAKVPGAFELPLCAQRLASTGRYDAIICLGAVVRGDTPHFDYVAGEAARGLCDVALRHDIPVAFGVLTTDDMSQALARAGGGHGNKGFDAALTALEMVGLLRAIHRS
jgi:6,7-dimethyl-8-ribityllumazine synthase